MSGICGSWAGNQRDKHFELVSSKIAYRGKDGRVEWQDPTVGLGGAFLATSLPSSAKNMLAVDPEKHLVVIADTRLDNREKLLSLVGAHGSASNAEIILMGYRLWGEDLPRYLVGDFAFAIWDGARREFFCARDHMGLRPFYYSFSNNRLFVFASDFDAVAAHPLIPEKVSNERIGDFLDDREGGDFESTFHPDIRRLPPAHWLRVTPGRIEKSRYWHLTPPPVLKLGSDDEYAAAFLKIFRQSVHARLDGVDEPGAMLSGGIDSAAVAAIAAEELKNTGRDRLRTFSAISTREDCEETRRIAANIEGDRYRSERIACENLGDYSSVLSRLARNSGEPFDCWMSLPRAVYALAATKGVRVLLDGVGGDIAFIRGNATAEYLASFQFGAARKALSDEEIFVRPESSRFGRAVAAAWAAFAPAALRRLAKRRRSGTRFAENGISRIPLTEEFYREANVRCRRDAIAQQDAPLRPFGRHYRISIMTSPFVTAGRERYERSAAAFQIEPRDPFLDIRVLEFCLSLPPNQLSRDGWPKFLLRKSMENRLPRKVLWTRGKHHLGPCFTEAVIADWEEVEFNRIEIPAILSSIVDCKKWCAVEGQRDKLKTHPLLALSFWLNRSRTRSQRARS